LPVVKTIVLGVVEGSDILPFAGEVDKHQSDT